MARQGNFDVSAEMRAFAEKSVEQTRAALDSFVTAAQQTVTAAESQAMTAKSGVREVRDLAARYAEDNISAAFDFAARLTRAKDAKEATTLHADYLAGQIAALAEQAKELSRQTVKMAGQASQH